MTEAVSWNRFDTTPLKHMARIRSSNVDKVINEDEAPVRLCNYVDVYYNERITSEIEFSAGSATRQEIERFALRAGDVLITKDSETPDDIAVPALVHESAEGIVCGYHVAILRPVAARADSGFLFWALKAHPVRDAFSIRAQGITRFGLTLDGIGSVRIPAPAIHVQRIIGDFLDRETMRIDKIIERVGGQTSGKVGLPGSFLSLLLEKRAALITAAVTGQIDLKTLVKRSAIRTIDRNEWAIRA